MLTDRGRAAGRSASASIPTSSGTATPSPLHERRRRTRCWSVRATFADGICSVG